MSLEQRSINTLRVLSIDAIEQANSGHPGLPMGAAPMAYVLWQNHLKHNPADATWPNRDRFVLSAGHGSALLYSLLHLTGYDVSLDDLRSFRQWGSRTPGHPEFGETPGVDATTGPLGQGFANAVGMAIAERRLAAIYNRPGHAIVDHYTYTLCSDGDLMEGVCAEAAALAGHLGLGKAIFLFDSNDISLDGPTKLSFTEDVAKRFESYGWQVLTIAKGDDDLAAIDAAIAAAKAEAAKPSLLIVRTTIGYGSPAKAGTSKAHGAPLGTEERAATLKAYDWQDAEPFVVPDEVQGHMNARATGVASQQAWQEAFDKYAAEHGDLAAQWTRAFNNEQASGWDEALAAIDFGESLETRSASGKSLNALAGSVPGLMGLDADLSSSTKGFIADGGDFEGASGSGRNVRCGVREHAMASVANGIAYHGGLRPFTSTFFVFSDYMRPAVRLAAMNKLPVIYVWTHDSIAVGEDGPTHQPVEHLASLRAMPGLEVFRPGDARETAAAWRAAIARTDGPTALVLTRQKLPVATIDSEVLDRGVERGAYVLAEASGPAKAVLLATGSEVSVALAARASLEKDGIPTRVVSMPSWERFAAQSDDYRDSVMLPDVDARVSIEAASTFGWRQYLGPRGVAIGLDRFGASAPGPLNLEKFGFSADNVARVTRALAKVVDEA